MNYTNYNFPVITYEANKTPFDWGFAHGKEFKQGIEELYQIRKRLMLEKNPALEPFIEDLALKQFQITKDFSPRLAEEMEGIAKGSELSLSSIVILNNYTDFRDIQLPEEGCSTIHVQKEKISLAGQTWDMHGSAKNYLCVIKVPKTKQNQGKVILSLVGCVGLMGINEQGCLVGVNNINTKNAKAGLIWPALVRQCLEGQSREELLKWLKKAPVTSGHNYIISDVTGGEHWEITPDKAACPTMATNDSPGSAFHTNHCLHSDIKAIEISDSLSSTTFNRYNILERKVGQVASYEDLYALLTDHEEYPKSICSHFETSAQDPSFTCGGGVMDFNSNKIKLWRGCPVHDEDYVEHNFKLDNGSFLSV